MTIQHVSEKPWSDYKESDYTLEQWHKACLIHQHQGPPTSKSECKLPVKTPNGVVNRNGVHAAASVLAGGRGGVHASSEEKAAAKRSIVSLYGQLSEDPPTSLKQSGAETMENAIEFLEHHGVKGQKWGTRKARRQEHKEFLKTSKNAETANKVYNEAVKTMNPVLKKINKDPLFKDVDMNKPSRDRDQYDAVVGTIFNQHLADASVKHTYNPNINRAIIYQFDRHSSLMRATEVKAVFHADQIEGFPDFGVVIDADGFVVEIKIPEDSDLSQSDGTVIFLEHHGVKGQKWGVRTKSSGHKSSSESKKTSALRSKPVHSLTNKQLKTANERMNLEQNFKRMNPSKVASGKKAATEILATVGIGVAVFNLVTSPAGKAAVAAGKKVLSR